MLVKLVYQVLKVYWFIFRPVTLGVRIMMYRDGQVLLVKHSYQDHWFLPGGGVKRGETLEQAVRREAFEECGAEIKHLQFLGVFSSFIEYKSDHINLFLSQDFTLEEKNDHEIEQVSFFPTDQLPPKLSPGSRRKIEAYINDDLKQIGAW